jgi:hypothetical protein
MNYRYINTERERMERECVGKWIKNYSIENYGKDWNYCLGLSYKNYVVSERICDMNMKELYFKLQGIDTSIDGFYVNEFEKNGIGVHHHLIIKSDMDLNGIKKNIEKIWGGKGISHIMEYDGSKNYILYMVKHLGKTNRNKWNNLKIS